MELWLIGSGLMAQDYAKVLQALGCDFRVIGRGETSAKNFQENTGLNVIQGGLNLALANYPNPVTAIVAVGVEQLAMVTKELLRSGTRKILLEKPGGIDIEELVKLDQEADNYDAQILLAYNRRFYSSTLCAEEIIKEDGGVTSFHFEFTEWSHQIQHLQKAPRVMENWVLGNSSHVLDLAFYLGGFPKDWKCYSQGGVSWHQTSSRFCVGISEKVYFFLHCRLGGSRTMES